MTYPTDPKGLTGIICYKNGSLAREFIRESCANGSRDKFNEYFNRKKTM